MFGMGKRSADKYHTAFSALGSPPSVRIGEQQPRPPSRVSVNEVIAMGLAAMKYLPRPARENFFLDSPLS
jgi:hypothetical protein